MKRAEAIRQMVPMIGDALVITCNGMIGRELFTYADSPGCFYMIGSMGLAGPIGLGVALTRPDRRVVVLDGDGNVLMNAGTLGNIAAAAPPNLYHVVLDNAAYGSTGDQKTISPEFSLAEVAHAFGYRCVFSASDEHSLAQVLPAFFENAGPSMLHVRVERGNVPQIARVSFTPTQLVERFQTEVSGGRT